MKEGLLSEDERLQSKQYEEDERNNQHSDGEENEYEYDAAEDQEGSGDKNDAKQPLLGKQSKKFNKNKDGQVIVSEVNENSEQKLLLSKQPQLVPAPASLPKKSDAVVVKTDPKPSNQPVLPKEQKRPEQKAPEYNVEQRRKAITEIANDEKQFPGVERTKLVEALRIIVLNDPELRHRIQFADLQSSLDMDPFAISRADYQTFVLTSGHSWLLSCFCLNMVNQLNELPSIKALKIGVSTLLGATAGFSLRYFAGDQMGDALSVFMALATEVIALDPVIGKEVMTGISAWLVFGFCNYLSTLNCFHVPAPFGMVSMNQKFDAKLLQDYANQLKANLKLTNSSNSEESEEEQKVGFLGESVRDSTLDFIQKLKQAMIDQMQVLPSYLDVWNNPGKLQSDQKTNENTDENTTDKHQTQDVSDLPSVFSDHSLLPPPSYASLTDGGTDASVLPQAAAVPTAPSSSLPPPPNVPSTTDDKSNSSSLAVTIMTDGAARSFVTKFGQKDQEQKKQEQITQVVVNVSKSINGDEENADNSNNRCDCLIM